MGSTIFIDIEHAIIVDVEPTPARTYDEVASTGARDELHLAAIVQNLKIMALRLVGPPPTLGASTSTT